MSQPGALIVLLAALPVVLAGCESSGPSIPADGAMPVALAEAPHWSGPVPSTGARAQLAEARRVAGLGRSADAASLLRDLVLREPAFVDAHRLLQDVLLGTLSDWWLRRTYRDFLDAHRGDPNALYLGARLHPDRATRQDLLEAALEGDPLHPYALVGLALSAEREGDVARSIELAQRAAAHAPWLALPWLYLGHTMAGRGEMQVAERFYLEARERDPSDPRTLLGLAATARHQARDPDSSAFALEAYRLAPGDSAIAGYVADYLERSSIPSHLSAALEIADRSFGEVGDPVVVQFFRGRMLLALGRHAEAIEELQQAEASGFAPATLAMLLRRARVRSGRYAEAVRGALANLPPAALDADNLFSSRWAALGVAAERLDQGDPRSLLALSEAMRSVGWLDEARVVLTRARANDPSDAGMRRRSTEEMRFGLFLRDLELLSRQLSDARRKSRDEPSLERVLGRIAYLSQRRLGRDITEGARVRSYPLLGSFALSLASGGSFEGEFGERGLLLLIGQRSGQPTEVALGRIVLARSDTRAVVLGQELAFDECWVESTGLPSNVSGLRPGLAGVTLDRFVLIQLDAVRRRPRPPDPRLPFEPRSAVTSEERLALDTPSLVAVRIEQRLADEGKLDAWMLDAVRKHELVHVLDARNLLPIHLHPLQGLAFMFETGFDPRQAEHLLEARAAALSLVACDEPRAGLASLLAFLPDLDGSSAHPGAYADVVREALAAIEEHPDRFQSLDFSFNLVQQLDRLTTAETRELGRLLLERY